MRLPLWTPLLADLKLISQFALVLPGHRNSLSSMHLAGLIGILHRDETFSLELAFDFRRI